MVGWIFRHLGNHWCNMPSLPEGYGDIIQLPKGALLHQGILSLVWYVLDNPEAEHKYPISAKDFEHFMGRITFGADKVGKAATDEMWNKTLIKLSGDEWKEVRSMFSPCFTSGRIKMMTKFMKVGHYFHYKC